ncbi:structural maintenance of chromosomes protein 1A-like [Chironomus tepperi]|uniref:structural maintenance of chromosomes protein 1A-like n=1 Tax=Chironomus tepperi TaxID=113505 RepID=UPI00391F72C3
MTSSKIVKIIINKFGEYNGEINLNDCTLINCVYLSSKEISKLTNVLKFMFSNEEISDIDELKHVDISDDAECPYVEAHIRTPSNGICILKKSYNNGLLNYVINGTESTQEYFHEKLQEHRCLFTFTCYLSPRAIESLMNLNDTSRINLIESICGNSELKLRYNQHKTKMGELEISMKLLNEHKKEFFSEKKQEKLRIENSKKIKKATNEFEKAFEQFSLMRLYHNEKKIKEIIPEELNALVGNSNDAIAEYKNYYVNYKENLTNKFAIEKDIIKSDINLNKLLNDFIAYKKNLMTYTEDLESIETQRKFAELIDNECAKYKAQVDESSEKLQHLENGYRDFKDTIPEYSELRNKFVEANYDYMLYISTKRQIDQFQSSKDKIEKNKLLVKCLVDENTMFKEQLKVLEKNEKELAKNLNTLNAKVNKLKPESIMIEKIINKGKKAITDKLLNNSYSMNDIKRIEQRLRDKFSDSIIGILSELFDVKESNGMNVTKSQILRCLGKYSNAIVVESPAILKEVSKYLKMQQNEQISIILMPQKYYKSTNPINLRNKSLPNIKMTPIESFLDPASDEIMTILMHILEPTIVCDCKTFDAVHKVFNHLGKNVKVTSFAASISVTPKRLILLHSTMIDDENIVDIARNVIENRMKAIDLNCDLQVEYHKFLLSLGRLSNIKVIVKYMKEAMARNTNCIDALNKKTEKLEELIKMLDNDNYAKIVETYEELRAKFRPLLNDHYRRFCKKYKLKNIDEYETMAPKFIHYASSRKVLQDNIKILNDQLENLALMQVDTDFYDNEKAQLERNIGNTKLEVERAREQLDVAKAECEAYYSKWMEKIVEIVSEKEKCAEINENLKTILLKICSAMNEKRILLNENYKLFNHIFSNFEKISLEDGSLLSQLTFNSDTNESFDLILYHLNQIRPNYDALKNELKDVNHFKKASLDLQTTISTLKKALNEFPLDFRGNDDELASINEKMNSLSMEIKNANNDCQKVLGTLKAVTEDRKKRFTECLEVINDEIKKFCRITTNDRLYGELMPVNESEPFLDLQYCWQSNNGTEFVNGSTRNWEAALAFWLGLVRYKKQNFVPYFEMSSDLPILNAIQKYSNSSETDLQAMVFWKTGIDEDMCHFTIMRYRDKMRIVDNEEQKRKLEILLD